MFGGESAEHEVSVITGLQVLENIDRGKYDPIALSITQKGIWQLYPGLVDRKGFLNSKPVAIELGRDEKGGYILITGIRSKKIYPACAYLAFHGGSGESGPIQGLLEALKIPFTSPSVEGSVIAMNKQLSKEVLASQNINTVKGVSVFSSEYLENPNSIVTSIIDQISLPVIIKPAHLGSSIGIKVANTAEELNKALSEASLIDIEIVVEKLMSNFVEYNCSVRTVNNEIVTSEIERPLGQDEILSFADKYQRSGGKKQSSAGGMANLVRELPAVIGIDLEEKIKRIATQAYKACRLDGLVRIDFMYTNDRELYLTEINPIPGSVSFYLWEASGISFKKQISESLEQAITCAKTKRSKRIKYESDIVEKFVTAG